MGVFPPLSAFSYFSFASVVRQESNSASVLLTPLDISDKVVWDPNGTS